MGQQHEQLRNAINAQKKSMEIRQWTGLGR